jgi:ferredoxin-type protein NapH
MIQDIRRLFLSFVLVVAVMYATDGFSVGGRYFSDFFRVEGGFIRVYLAEMEVILLASIFLGLSFGRIFCGWLCPLAAVFNFLAPMSRREATLDRRWKYATLAGTALLLYYSPGIELSLPLEVPPRYLAIALLLVIVLSSLVYGRVFCTSLCPVGGWFSALGKLAVFRLRVGEECTACERCNRVCEMRLQVAHAKSLHECSLCWACVEECPYRAIRLRFILS